MDFMESAKVTALKGELASFFDEFVLPQENRYQSEVDAARVAGNAWITSRVIEALKEKARERGLWNLFLTPTREVPDRLTNLEYAPLCEIMGRVPWSAEVFNCSAPDTGNMEILERYGSGEQKRRWLAPLMKGDIRSAFLMTEPAVASSDATNIECSIRREGDAYVINGRKWWSSGAGDPRCAMYIVMGKTNPDADLHQQQSMVLVPADAPGVRVLRPMRVFGYDDAPHGHMDIELVDVRVPLDSVLLGEGRGFEIAQGRLGPGRIHHCMRLIGLAERALELMCSRVRKRVAFGRPIGEFSVWHERIAESRCMIDQARLLTLSAAYAMDTLGIKGARKEIAMIKVVAPTMAEKIIDWSIQAHGGAGVSQDFPLAQAYTIARSLRLADGPDEVHRASIAKHELAKSARADGES
ncbi:MAG: acyl-CoA dehydrogenase family protein [Pseudomonadota bacterium]|nr:acyl-CoA dehydrogenase family protein [Pseudomonadota bacterium]